MLHVHAFIAAVLVASGISTSPTCRTPPPRLWRHWGCSRFDCGDLGGSYDGCVDTPSGSECADSSWNCSSGAAFDAVGKFACVAGRWADILPLCLGTTSPVHPGGTWRSGATEVRAVLFQLAVAWNASDAPRLDLCTRSLAGDLVPPCRRIGFAEFAERSLWPLF